MPLGPCADPVYTPQQLKIASGERSSAESVAQATDPPNLIRLVPAKEAGPFEHSKMPSSVGGILIFEGAAT